MTWSREQTTCLPYDDPDDWLTLCRGNFGIHIPPPALPLSAAAVVCGRCASPPTSFNIDLLPIRCINIREQMTIMCKYKHTHTHKPSHARRQHYPSYPSLRPPPPLSTAEQELRKTCAPSTQTPTAKAMAVGVRVLFQEGAKPATAAVRTGAFAKCS
jgi:hypothetical protein